MKTVLFGLLTLDFMFSSSAYGQQEKQSVVDQTDQQKKDKNKNKKWLEGVKFWQDESQKADVIMSCIGIDKNEYKLQRLPDLHTTIGGVNYNLIVNNSNELKFFKGVEPTDLFGGNWKSSGEATITLSDGSTVTAKKVSEDWIRIEILSEDGQNRVEIDWRSDGNTLVIHDTSCESWNCAFAGKSVHVVNGKDGANRFENVVVLTDDFRNFGNIDSSKVFVISPNVYNIWRTEKGFANLHSLEGLSYYDINSYKKYLANNKRQNESQNMTVYRKHALNIGMLELASNIEVLRFENDNNSQKMLALGKTTVVIFKVEQEEIPVLINNIGGTLYFFDPMNKQEFDNPKVKRKLEQAIERAGVLIKLPINYVNPNKK